MAPQAGLQLYSLRDRMELDEVAGDMVDAVAQSYRYLAEHGLARGKT